MNLLGDMEVKMNMEKSQQFQSGGTWLEQIKEVPLLMDGPWPIAKVSVPGKYFCTRDLNEARSGTYLFVALQPLVAVIQPPALFWTLCFGDGNLMRK